ncbi:DUF6968 family protein [Stutzerimonas urumqiensis]|uniref:DUF6968 family protein n=1 Tax=Stutzerimonas urumqiensis TaxID=638269 RepID=UPI0013CE5140|nr:hypothetical protein [Stutzerimonas urumqiensis]
MTKLLRWSNPYNVDLSRHYLYYIEVKSEWAEFRYVGKASAPGRMNAYWHNVEKALTGRPKRPAKKRNGVPQSARNVRFRFVHLVLAAAVLKGWKVSHYPLENCSKEQHRARELELIAQMNCNMNDGPSWLVEDLYGLVDDLAQRYGAQPSISQSMSDLPLIPSRFTSVVASRELQLVQGDTTTPLLFEVGSPVRDVPTVAGFDWRCPVRVTEGASRRERQVCGVDSFQALELALRWVASEADAIREGGTHVLFFGERIDNPSDAAS